MRKSNGGAVISAKNVKKNTAVPLTFFIKRRMNVMSFFMTVCRKDAATERTGRYSQRVMKNDARSCLLITLLFQMPLAPVFYTIVKILTGQQ
jgi:hypothetical protein